MKKVLLGNEAIVQGALEAGVNFVSAYPGTPSSEIPNTFYQIAEGYNVYFEFSTNEKVALEAAIGASYSGLKCLVSMKHFGINVCADSLLPFCYTGAKGPVVIVVADDPSCYSSGQSEENSRGFAYLAHIPILEPSDAQEAKDFTKLAFRISEKFKIPVILRITTRVAHQRMPVEIGAVKATKATKGEFVKNPHQFVTMPPRVLEMKDELLAKIEKIREFAEQKKINKVLESSKKSKLGIVVSGISYLYIREALERLNLNLPILKINLFYPLTQKQTKNFIKNLKKVLVVEELEGYLEKEIKVLAKDVNPKLSVYGKDILPVSREFNLEKVIFALSKVSGKKYKKTKLVFLNLPKRFPRLCAGCPYWLVFSAVKKIAPKNTIFGGDIGCYMLAGFPPHNIQDYLLDMGSSLGIAHGIKKTSPSQKLIAFIGDSTFFHAGIPALINCVFNKSNPLIIVMDNRITAMTGHQPRHGACDSLLKGRGACKDISIEEIVRACGVVNVRTVNPVNFKEFESTVKEFLNKKEISVIIAQQMCAYWAGKIKKIKNENK